MLQRTQAAQPLIGHAAIDTDVFEVRENRLCNQTPFTVTVVMETNEAVTTKQLEGWPSNLADKMTSDIQVLRDSTNTNISKEQFSIGSC